MNEESYIYLKRKVRELAKIDLDDYKSRQMKRRLSTYVDHVGTRNIVEFCRMLEEKPPFLQKFLDFLTINVSEFFRDPQIFTDLQSRILPELVQDAVFLNIWSAGCSRGQEPYSIAMLLDALYPSARFRILATDINEEALRTAAAGGPYTADDVNKIPDVFRDAYLTPCGEKFMVNKELGKRIEFKRQNLLSDPFEKQFDQIVCRNVTIFFTEEAKNELNRKFYNSLRDKGVLFVGGAEVMLFASHTGFKNEGKCFYRKCEQDLPDPVFCIPKTPVIV